MHRAVLRLVAKTFSEWLRKQLPPSGQPTIHDFEARVFVLINSVPAEASIPGIGTVQTLTEDNVRASLEWLFLSMSAAFANDSWAPFALQMARLHAIAATPEILGLILDPHRTLAEHQ